MKALDTFRVNRVERVFLERWVKGQAVPGSKTSDGGLAVLKDGTLAMVTAKGSINLAIHEKNRIRSLTNKLESNPVVCTYLDTLNEIVQQRAGESRNQMDSVLLAQQMSEATSSTANDSLRDLARDNRPVLKHMISLSKLYRGDDPQLSSKEAKTAMQAILHVWDGKDADAAHMFGRVNWEPDPIIWMSFFDEVGVQPLGKFLDIGSTEEIPEVPGSEDELAPEDFPEEPEYDHDEHKPDSEEFDASSFLQ